MEYNYRLNLDHVVSRLNCLNLDHVVSRLTCYTKNFHHPESNISLSACKFRKDSRCDLLAVGTRGGHVVLYDTSDEASESVIGSINVAERFISDICWLPDKCQLIAGVRGGVSLLDMCQLQLLSSFKSITPSVSTVDVCYEQSAIFASGTEFGGDVSVWDTRESNAKPTCFIPVAHDTQAIGFYSPTSSVAFQDSTTLATCSVEDDYIKIWDLRRICLSNQASPIYQIKSCNETPGYCSIVFDSTYKNLYACQLENHILKFDCHSYSTEAVYKGCNAGGHYQHIALSCDDQYLLSGTSIDTNAYIWNTSDPSLPILTLSAHEECVNGACWSPYDCTKLVTSGDDHTFAIWKASNLDIDDGIDVRAKAKPYGMHDLHV